LFDRHNGAGAGVAAGTGTPFPDRKRPEAANFDPVSPAQRFVDRAHDRIDETLNITPIEMRILRSDVSNKLGFDHRVAALLILRVSTGARSAVKVPDDIHLSAAVQCPLRTCRHVARSRFKPFGSRNKTN
jgi:hypothetical protein